MWKRRKNTRNLGRYKNKFQLYYVPNNIISNEIWQEILEKNRFDWKINILMNLFTYKCNETFKDLTKTTNKEWGFF